MPQSYTEIPLGFPYMRVRAHARAHTSPPHTQNCSTNIIVISMN